MMDNMTNTVSVVIPTYNRAHVLPRALESLFRQTYKPHEIIVVDDGSTDDTCRLMAEISQKHSNIRYVRLEKGGAQVARNRGIRQATGDWITFLDSDDEYLPEKIEQQFSAALSMGIPVIHCECFLYDIRTGERKLRGTAPLTGTCYAFALSGNSPTFPGIFAHRACFERIGYLDERVAAYQEWETAIRLASLFSFHYIPQPLFVYYVNSGDAISKNTQRAADGWAYIIEKHSVDIAAEVGWDKLAELYQIAATHYEKADLPVKANLYRAKASIFRGNNTSSVLRQPC